MMSRLYKSFHPLLWILPLWAILESCTPQISAVSSSIPQGATGKNFSCNPSAAPIADQVLRLTIPQYQNTVYALIVQGLISADLNAFPTTFSTALSSITFPSEGNYALGNAMVYNTQDQSESSALVTAEYGLAYAMAQYVIANTTRLTAFVNHYASAGSCPSSGINNTGASKACYDSFIKNFGLYALRRPVVTANNTIDSSSSNAAAANDLTYYEGVYTDATNGGFDSLLSVMLTSPDTVFLTQFSGGVAGTASPGAQINLTYYETAAKLAYYYTNSPPDAQLLSAASAGFVGTGNTIAEQSKRLFNTPNARGRFTDFFTQWIRPKAIPTLNTTSNAPATDLTALRTNAIQEMVDLTTYYTFGATNGKASDLLSSTLSFAKTADLAAIYNVPQWTGPNSDGSYDPSKLVSFPASNPHAGLFTRAAYSFSGSRDPNLIIRGSRIYKDYFCQSLSPPAAFTLSTTVPIVGAPTVRNLVVANTQNPATSCASCHTTIINPLGFALNNYDSFGRYRSQEPLFASNGTIASYISVDASSQPFQTFKNPVLVDDPVVYSQDIGKSTAFNTCFVRHYFRYAQARGENDSADGCKLNQMLNALNAPNSGSIQNMIHSVPNSQSFITRNITP